MGGVRGFRPALPQRPGLTSVLLVPSILLLVTLAGCSNPEDSTPETPAAQPVVVIHAPTAVQLGSAFTPTAKVEGAEATSWHWTWGQQTSAEQSPTLQAKSIGDTRLSVVVATRGGGQASSEATISVVEEAVQVASPTHPDEAPMESGNVTVNLVKEPSIGGEIVLRLAGGPNPTLLAVEIDGVRHVVEEPRNSIVLPAPDESGEYLLNWTITSQAKEQRGSIAFDTWGLPIAFPEPTATQTRPGVTSSECTTNFLFHYKYYRYFLGSAAHCLDAGDSATTGLNGCEAQLRPLGDEESLETGVSATIAYSSWMTMQRISEAHEDTCYANDFALLEIAPDDWQALHPAIFGLGEVKGLSTSTPTPGAAWGGSGLGEEVTAYGRSSLRDCLGQCRTDDHDSMVDSKEGHFMFTSDANFTHRVYLVTPAIPGDSGGPLLSAEGYAMGVASWIEYAPYSGSNGYTNLAMALQYMEKHEGWSPEVVPWVVGR